MTVLVTGSAGTIGRFPGPDRCRRSAGSCAASTGSPPTAGIEQVRGEITDPQALDRAMAGVRAVVHLAGQAAEAPWPVIREANLEGTYQVFEAARRAGVRRLVYASSNHAAGFTPRPADRLRAARRHPAPAGHPVRGEQGLR